MRAEDKHNLLILLPKRMKLSEASTEDWLRAKMDLENTEAQTQAAIAEERAAIASEKAADASIKNARYMLWSVIAAALSAVGSLVSTALAVFGHH